jgi:hypothetical protein
VTIDDDRPPICPPDEHQEVCHCGDDMGAPYSNHVHVSMGCFLCMRRPEEIALQGRAA